MRTKLTIEFDNMPFEKREDVANYLQSLFPENLITTGGHHVAFHTLQGDRAFVITSNHPDWK